MTDSGERAIVLLSGGLDSATVLAIARSEELEVHALSFAYGQRHAAELEAAARVAMVGGAAAHKVVHLDTSLFVGSALTDAIPVPKDRTDAVRSSEIPVTYVPARNTVFLAHAVAWAEVLGAGQVFIGVNALDYSGYPDCRPEYIEAFERMAALATKAAVEGRALAIRAPLLDLTKADIIRRGLALGVDYRLTISCYDADGQGAACGRCDACQLRLRGFRQAGATDPAPYVAGANSR